MGNINIITIFTTGLLTGGLTCMAVQGGLLASTIAQREEERLKEKLKGGHALPILSFLVAKLIAYTFLGLMLGWLGSFFTLSIKVQVVLQILVAIFMLGTAGALLEIHPIFRYFIIQPPKFFTKSIRNQSKSGNIFAPAILGALTIFIPCGTTQAMMALAVGSGSPFLGALILFSFVLGTSPVFFLLGYFAAKLSDTLNRKFLKVAAVAIFILAIFNLNNGLKLAGSGIALGNLLEAGFCSVAYCQSSDYLKPEQQDAVAEQNIDIGNNGYSPRVFTVKAGSEVKLRLNNRDAYSCAQAFTIPRLNIQKVVSPGNSEEVVFRAPSKPGKISFSCSMGMYSGVINVVE